MECPLCKGNAPYDEIWQDNEECSITDYRCENGHLVQFILPQQWMTVLILTEDGDEIYQFHFDDNNNITRVLDWDLGKDLNLEGEGAILCY